MSDDAKSAEREPGFYWIKIEIDNVEDWEIAKWDDGWCLSSSPDGYWSVLLYNIIEVDERRIERTLPQADRADRIAEIIAQHTGMYVVSAHGIALEIVAALNPPT